MIENAKSHKLSPKSVALCALGIGAIGFAALKLPGAIDKLSDPTQRIPPEVRRLLNLTSRITEEGAVINGAWISRNAADQDFIDSACYVVNFLTRENKDRYNAPKIGAILDQQLITLEAGLIERRESFVDNDQRALESLCRHLRSLRLSRKCPEAKTARLVNMFCAPFRVVERGELTSVRQAAAARLENVSYFGLPDL